MSTNSDNPKPVKIMIDPPVGHRYGFPKALPKEAVAHYKNGHHGIKQGFRFEHWLREQGYPVDEMLEQLGSSFMVRQWIEDDDSGL